MFRQKFNFCLSASFFNRGNIRDALICAVARGRCGSFNESPRLLYSRFYVNDADEGITRKLLGNEHVDGVYAIHNQKQAMLIGSGEAPVARKSII